MSCLENVIFVFPQVLIYLNGVDLYQITLVCRSLAKLVIENETFDRSIWRNLCKTDFGLETLTFADSTYRKKWLGITRWNKSPNSKEEIFVQAQPNERQTVSLFNGFGTGILIRGTPLAYVFLEEWIVE